MGHIPKRIGIESGAYPINFPLSPRIIYPEYPENPNNLGEAIRKARIDKGLMIKELGELVGTNEARVISWEIRGRRPEDEFHGSLRRVLDIDVESQCSE